MAYMCPTSGISTSFCLPIPQKYSDRAHLFSAFYRETIQKRKRYIGISEAVLDAYKTDYRERDITNDRVQILRG